MLPRSSEDIATTIAACRESGTTVVTRGGGTSIGGNITGTGTVIDTSRYLDGSSTLIHTARVQPGVVLDDLRAAANVHGLTFGPDPSTHDRAQEQPDAEGQFGNNLIDRYPADPVRGEQDRTDPRYQRVKARRRMSTIR